MRTYEIRCQKDRTIYSGNKIASTKNALYKYIIPVLSAACLASDALNFKGQALSSSSVCLEQQFSHKKALLFLSSTVLKKNENKELLNKGFHF